MARLKVLVKGTPNDHILISDTLSDEEAAKQLQAVTDKIGRVGVIRLPWMTAFGPTVLVAQILNDEPTVQASAGHSSIMGDLAGERF